MADSGPVTCCMRATDAEIHEDPGAYNCDVCPLASALVDLRMYPENERAWYVYQQLASRFSVDTHTCAVVLERLTKDDEPDEFADLMQRLAVLYDVLQPQAAPES